MKLSNTAVADLLRQYAAVLALEGANRFKLKAYRRAAGTIEELDEDVADLVRRGEDLRKLPGIGDAIRGIVTEVVETGKLPRLEQTTARLGPELAELASRPRLDPAKVKRVYKKLDIHSLAELRQKLDAGEIAAALGSRLDFHVRQGLDERPRQLLWNVEDLVQRIERFLRAVPGVSRVAVAGSVRRRKDTVGDLNFVVAAKSPATVMDKLQRLGGVLRSEKTTSGEIRLFLSAGTSATVRFEKPAEWAFQLVEATGSPLHLADLRELAASRGIAFGPRSFRGSADEDDRAVYASLGIDYIEPELREGQGEVDAAARRRLPRLVTLQDLRGDLHMHTLASDGTRSIEEMAAAAEERGYEYIAITDHSQSLRLTNGLSEERLLEQVAAIDRLNERRKGVRILKSAEVDILKDGRLDYPDHILRQLDLTICSIHSHFGLGKNEQTERILRAMDNRHFTILGHATGRLLLRRPGYELDMPRVLCHARECGCFFEINSSPDRLDLSEIDARAAREEGVKIAINTDAHGLGDLAFMTAGVEQARRAWLEPQDILNSLTLPELLRAFRR